MNAHKKNAFFTHKSMESRLYTIQNRTVLSPIEDIKKSETTG